MQPMKKTDPLKTVLTISVGFLLIFFITRWKGAVYISAGVGLAGLISAQLARWIDFGWMKLAHLLSLIVPNILLGAIYFLILFPLAKLSGLFRKTPLLQLKNTMKSVYTGTEKNFKPE